MKYERRPPLSLFSQAPIKVHGLSVPEHFKFPLSEICLQRKARRRTFVLQVLDNKTDLVKLAAPCGFKYRTIFNSGGVHLLGEHSKLDNTL